MFWGRLISCVDLSCASRSFRLVPVQPDFKCYIPEKEKVHKVNNISQHRKNGHKFPLTNDFRLWNQISLHLHWTVVVKQGDFQQHPAENINNYNYRYNLKLKQISNMIKYSEGFMCRVISVNTRLDHIMGWLEITFTNIYQNILSFLQNYTEG